MKPEVFQALHRKGISQAKLAGKIGISPRALCQKFGGKRPFLYREVVKICNILDIQNPLDFPFET